MMRFGFLVLLMLPCVGQSAAPLRYHTGDDLRWAAKDFDDRSWPVAADGHVVRSSSPDRMLWVRTQVVVPADVKPEALIFPGGCSEVGGPEEIFIEGVKVAAYGHFGANPDGPPLPGSCVFTIPPGLATAGKPVNVAIRRWTAFWTLDRVPGTFGPKAIGSRSVLEERAWRRRAEMRERELLLLVSLLFAGIAGTALLLLRRFFGGQELLFWLALYLVIYGWGYLLIYATVTDWLNFMSIRGLHWLLTLVVAVTRVAVIEMLRAGCKLPRNRIVWTIETFVAVVPLYRLLDMQFGLPRDWYEVVDVIAVLGFVATGCLALYALRRPGDGRLVALGVLTPTLVIVAIDYLGLPEVFRVGPFLYPTFTVSILFTVSTVAAVLVKDLVRNWRRKERIQADVSAAREVQAMLMPEDAPSVAGFRIEAAYLPADEVGGDFYRVLPCGEEASWILVGDVSGKGLRAAMVVSIVAGAAEAIAVEVETPADFLKRLNAVVTGRLSGGFVTCCCMRLETSGAYTLANAGHLAPYAGGRSLAAPSGLPLGITGDAEWDESAGALNPGETLVLLSDGVVEARRPGGELYGFERVDADMGTFTSAASLARRAQQFGQEDDITVLAITRLSAAFLT